MASALLKTESCIDKVGEITESLPTSPARSAREFELHYDGTFDRGLDTALEGLGFVYCVTTTEFRLYMKFDIPSGADTHSMELHLQEGESVARPVRVEPIVVEHFRSLESIQDLLLKNKATFGGVPQKFVLVIKLACGNVDMQEVDIPFDKKFTGWMEKKCKSRAKGGEWLFEVVLLPCIRFLTIPNANLAGHSWAMHCVECTKVVGLACIVGAFGMRNHEQMQSLLKVMIKAGAIAIALGIIMGVATPLPPTVGLLVGLVARSL
ncbi:hypothetical protein CDL12_07810 [Handroanthus impetiginosus]|uniref:Uncharacterized protein n=1 Tax=Handroanthus impetiginosus TaxID=429701 RepID=A0A2G9HQE9_9LAMI|nr:hypothetical protein CDL12_07810 [Handroanthus impetiginosus]